MLGAAKSLPNRYIHFEALAIFLEGEHYNYYEHKSEMKNCIFNSDTCFANMNIISSDK